MAITTDAVSSRSAPPSLRRFWNWWSGELIDWIPLKLRPATRFLNESLFVEIEGKRLHAKRYLDGGLQRLDDLDLAALPPAEQALALRAWLGRLAPALDRIALVLQPGDSLSRRIDLPRAAEENLRQAVTYELNRYTPFKSSDVYFDHRLLKPEPDQGGLGVQIAVAPKTRINPALLLLAQAGVRPAAVVLADDLTAGTMPLNLLPAERRAKTAARISASNTLLAVLAVILFVASLALPIWHKRQEVTALDPIVQRARREAEGADKIKNELEALVQTYDFLLQRKHTHPAATLVVDELTRVLPDGTWLQQMNLRSHPKGWEIELQGETTISSRLAGVIEDSPLFRDASFKSPLVKGQAPSSERFHLGAELELAPTPKGTRLADRRLPEPQAVERPAADIAPATNTPLAAIKP